MTTQNIPVGPQVDTQFLRSYTFPVTANNKKNIKLVLNINNYLISYVDFGRIRFKSFQQKFFIIMYQKLSSLER